MSTILRDLWPSDVNTDVVLSPEEILNFQAGKLEQNTSGRLVGHVEKLVGEERVVYSFEVEAPWADTRVQLFEVQRRPDYEYPAAIIPPDEDLPDFLKERVYRPGFGEIVKLAADLPASRMKMPGEWVENEWVASSPAEFSQKVGEILARPAVKAIVLSLLSRANQEASGNNHDKDVS
jgi:hypothetical protein